MSQRREHLTHHLKPCVLDQETSAIDFPAGLYDVWDNRLARVEKGPPSLRTVT
jgi:hypothetical protein